MHHIKTDSTCGAVQCKQEKTDTVKLPFNLATHPADLPQHLFHANFEVIALEKQSTDTD